MSGSGDAVLEDVIQSITLQGPSGPITVPTLTFFVTESIPMSFDADNGVWSYGADFDVYSSHVGYFDGPYEFGEYTITITDKDNNVFQQSVIYSAQPDLPQIPSDSFQGEISSSGDLVWRWTPISDADFWASGLDSTLRVWVYAKNGDEYVADAFGAVPLNGGMMYVPKSVLDKLKTKGSTLGVGLHIKNDDGLSHHRYYSKLVPLSDLSNLNNRNSSGFYVIPIPVN